MSPSSPGFWRRFVSRRVPEREVNPDAAGGADTSVEGDANRVAGAGAHHNSFGDVYHLRVDAGTAFDGALRTLSPWAAHEARELQAVWPNVTTAVSALAGHDTARGSILHQWADQEPSWLHDAPAQAFGWLGQLAADYDARRASQSFFERCIHHGGYPHDFLLARAALQAGSGTEQDVRDYLAAWSENEA